MRHGFKNAGRENYFEVEKDGHKNSNHADSNHVDSNNSDFITSDSLNIEPTNQYDLANYHLLQKLMTWNWHDPQASTFSTRTVPRNFTYQRQFPSYPPHPPPPNDLSSPANFTPKNNSTPCNSPSKPISHVPNEPDPEPSL